MLKTTPCPFSHYGITSNYSGNVDVKLRLMEGKGLDIYVDGVGKNRCSKADYIDTCVHKKTRRTIEDRLVTKESLAAKPIKYLLKKTQRHLSIWFDLTADQLKLRY